jgi:hypothetical protein
MDKHTSTIPMGWRIVMWIAGGIGGVLFVIGMVLFGQFLNDAIVAATAGWLR